MQENIVILGTGFIAGYLNRGLHYLFSELRQPMVGNVCAIGKHPEKLIYYPFCIKRLGK